MKKLLTAVALSASMLTSMTSMAVYAAQTEEVMPASLTYTRSETATVFGQQVTMTIVVDMNTGKIMSAYASTTLSYSVSYPTSYSAVFTFRSGAQSVTKTLNSAGPMSLLPEIC